MPKGRFRHSIAAELHPPTPELEKPGKPDRPCGVVPGDRALSPRGRRHRHRRSAQGRRELDRQRVPE